MLKKLLSLTVIVCFFLTTLSPLPKAHADTVLGLPTPGTMVNLSPGYLPVLIKGLHIHPQNPILFDFIIDTGNSNLSISNPRLKIESEKLIKYFLASLTIPEDDLWVNLSPYEKNRIIASDLGQTEMGRDMLAEDYILKQLTASLIYPEKNLGKEFWNRVYAKTQQLYGTNQVPVNTFNKVWIVADKAKVYVHGDTAFVVASHLKVMLEEDYLSLEKHNGIGSQVIDQNKVHSVGSQIVREVVLPELEKEVNAGKNFANLRQIFNSMILAAWYKKNLQKALLNQVYSNKAKINGVNVADKTIKEKIYKEYLQAYKKGVFNYIKQDIQNGQAVPRKYFSGGEVGIRRKDVQEVGLDDPDAAMFGQHPIDGAMFVVDAAMAQVKNPVSDMATMAPVLPRINPQDTPSWKKLETLAADKPRFRLRDLFAQNPQRAEQFLVGLNSHLEADFSKNLIDEETLDNLLALAKDVSLPEAIQKMFGGEKINETEQRAALHIALRNVKRDSATGELVAANGPILVDGQDVMPKVIEVLRKMEAFTKKIQSGEWRGASGKKIKNIINVGIGGSDLGPKMAVEALRPYKAGDVDAYFISNIDGTAAAELMKKLDPEETLIIIASKTFTTQETMQNAQTLKNWILNAYHGDPEVIKKHFVAVSTAKDLVTKFGIDPQNMFEFWDWVGGRYSVWSAIGLSLATYIGFDNFLQFLEGGHEADEHFRTQPFRQNIPVLKALLNVWYGNFLKADSFAILPYDQYMSLFPAFAQQFFMESNGKSVGRDGKAVGHNTGLIAWGAAGTDGQHSFYQLIHQGTRLVPADFIGIMRSHNPLPGHHEKLFSNFVAQTEALAFGATTEEVRQDLEADPKYEGQDLNWDAMQRTFTGNKPTTSILIDQMTPRTLGNLVALYEHQIFTEGIIWNIFSFDQWGVQLGKLVADKKVLPFLNGTRSLDELGSSGLSPAAQSTIRKFRASVEAQANEAMTVEIQPLAQTRPAKFGTSGDRGIIDWEGDGTKDFNIDLVRRDVQGIATHLLNTTDERTIIIGYDTRYRNPEFSKEAARIMAGNGFKVLYVAQEATPTPVLAILAANRKVAGVINFTASHSPYTDGGLKFSPSHGGAADTETTDSIEKLANSAVEFKAANYEGAVRDGQIDELDPQEAVDEYVNGYLVPTLKNTKSPDGVSAWEDIVNYVRNHPEFNLVIDPMQGTGVRTVQVLYGEIAKAAGRQFFKVIHTDNKDPKFTQTGGAPQPAGKYIQELLNEVKQTPHSMGIAVDGDVDRFGVVDFGGKQFEANEMIGMFAWFLKKDVGLDGSLVKTVATSNFSNAVAQHLDMKLIETPVGFKYAVQQVTNGENVLVAGEESAHVGIGPFMKSWDDGFAVGLTALWLVAKSGKTLGEYKDHIESEIGQSFVLKVLTARDEQGVAKANVIALIASAKNEMKSKPETEISIAKEAESLTGQKVIGINTMDGVKLVFETGDSILMRPSGTEPAAKLYVEVSNPERLDTMFKAASRLMGVDPAQLTLEDSNSFEEDAAPELVEKADTLPVDGGIDLNAKNMQMDISGQKINIQFDPAMVAQFRHGDFSGVRPVIMSITPIVNVTPLLGAKVENGHLAAV